MDGAQASAAPGAAGQSPAARPKDDRGGMFHYHLAKVRPLIVAHQEKKAAATAAATSVTSALDTMVADLNAFPGPKVDRDWVKRRIDMAGRNQRDLLEGLELERWGNQIQGIAEQIDAFGGAETPEAVRDARYFNAQGYHDGLNGLDSNPPDGMHSMYDNDYRTGWANGQAAMLEYSALGARLKEQQAAPQTEPPVNLNPDDEDDEEKIAAAARKLRNDPEFMARGEGEADGDDGKAAAPAPAKPKAKAGVH